MFGLYTTRDCIGNVLLLLAFLYMLYALYLAAITGPVLKPPF